MTLEAATVVAIVVLMPPLLAVLLVSEAVHAGFIGPPGGRAFGVVRAVLLLAFVVVIAVRLAVIT